MFAIGNDELNGKKRIGETVVCRECGETHSVEYGEKILPDGTKEHSKLLAFYRCGEQTYLFGIDGFAI